MRILVIGSGGREHALCWKIAASPLCEKLYCAPGNAGISAVAECVSVAADDIPGLLKLVAERNINFVIVGPEAPLVAGIVDILEEAGIPTFGPSKAAAALEGSKGFMKDMAAKYNVPTARYGRFSEAEAAKAFARSLPLPVVIKADGLAAGKGVIIAESYTQAEAGIDAMILDKQFGSAGLELVVEEFLEGEELSFFALCDGAHVVPLASAQDHKRVGDGDTGLNTGGMGAYSPAPVATNEIERRIMDSIIRPTIAGMTGEGKPFIGVLFAGIMVTKDGPKLIEFNVRFGDPECEVLMLRLKSDLLPALIAARDGKLQTIDLLWHPQAAVTIVMAAKGYPSKPEMGTVIKGLNEAGKISGSMIFHAGTKCDGDNIIAAGGRVLAVSAVAKDVKLAQKIAYQAVDAIDWPGGFCRRDIAHRAILRAS